jgi:hypothetical protein
MVSSSQDFGVEQMTFEQMTFEQMTFEQMTFEQMTFEQMTHLPPDLIYVGVNIVQDSIIQCNMEQQYKKKPIFN